MSAAQAQGLLKGETDPGEEPLAVDGLPSLWGARLNSLMEAGSLSRKDIDSLAWGATGEGAGSWVDPLFQGPAPIVELQGLGDRYRDLSFLGQGATAQVFKAMDSLLLRQVALKVLKDESAPTLVEARAQAQIEHPNVCRIYEVGQGYIVLQLVEGPSLARLAPSLSLEQRVRIIRDVARGVHAAHLKGLLHLDLKLDNILMQEPKEGTLQPVVSDFGMVRTRTSELAGGCPMGTPPYTSPEQLTGDPSRLGPASDVYAMGVMLYVLLAGASPFPAHDFPGLLEAMAKEPPAPLRKRLPNVPKDLECLILRCLEKDPASRYASAERLADELDRFLIDEPLEVMGRAVRYRLRKWVRRNRRLTWVAGLSLAALLGTAGILVRHIVIVGQQSSWDYHFQKQVEEMRTYLDRAYRLPEHDIEPELQHARGFVQAIRNEMAHQGKAAAGPGHLALGQALLLLDPGDPEAGEHFQRAWDSGLRTDGARIWLAFSLVKGFEKALTPIRAEADEGGRLESQLRKRYLEPALRMLEGRGSADQSRLAHMAQVAAIQSREGCSPDALVELARSYRARFPDDVDALLEEASALEEKASALWFKATQSAAWPPPCAAEVASLRRTSMDILLGAHRIAPSHPRIHEMLSWACAIQAESLAEDPKASQRMLAQAEDWLERGQRVSGNDPGLISSHIFLSGRDILGSRLRLGLDPGPQIRTFNQLLQRCWDSPDDRVFAMALSGGLEFAATYGRYGIRNAEPLLKALDRLEKRMAAGAGTGIVELYPLLEAGNYALEAGLDPEPCFRMASRIMGRRAEGFDWYSAFRLHLLEGEYRFLVGGDASEQVRQAEELLQGNKAKDRYRATLGALPLALLRARILDDSPSWAALKGSMSEAERTVDPRNAFNLLLLTKARLALGRHQRKVGLDIGSLLKVLRETLAARPTEGEGLPGHLLGEFLAELALLEAQCGKDAVGALRQGLLQADRALVYSLPKPQVSRGTSWAGPPHQGRTWALKGELALALAERSRNPGSRSRWARKAEAAFRTAIRYNPNLEHSLALALAHAQGLSRGKH